MNWLIGPAVAATLLASLSAASAQNAGLAVVIANSYGGFLTGTEVDADTVAAKAEQGGLSALRIVDVTGKDFAPKLDEIRTAAAAAGPLRLVYATGFGMCVDDDLMLFAEDMQPEQYNSGQLGDAVVPLSIVAEAAATGGGKVLVVFDTNANQCAEDDLKKVKLPAESGILLTTAVGGDVLDNFDESGKGAFATAFEQAFDAKLALKALAEKLAEQVKTITEEQQEPVLFGTLQ